MMRSIFVRMGRLACVGFPAASALIGCGQSDTAQQASPSSPAVAEGGGAPGAPSGADDAGSRGPAVVGDGGVACTDGGAGPKGTQVVRSATASIVGVTDDDEIVYQETSSTTLFAVKATGGGAPTSIGPTQGSVRIASRAVFNWTGLNQDGTVATSLQLWTAARGSQSLAGSSLVATADASADGARVLYFDDAAGSAADLYVAGADGSAKTKLASGIFWTQTCMPQASFVGSAAVLAYCTAEPADPRNPVGTIALYLGAAGTGMTLSTSASLSFQIAGTKILYNAAGGLVVADATTGTTTVIDPAGASPAFTHDGQGVVYIASDGSIRRSGLASPAPTTLVSAAGFVGLSALSPDDRWLLASKTSDPSTGNADIYIASAAAPGPATAILGSPTGTFYGSPFTADSSRVLYVDNTANGAGDYHAVPVAGGPSVLLGSRVWIGFATGGTRLLYQGGFVPMVGLQSQGAADIELLDVAAASPAPTLLVNQADPGLFFTSTGENFVYSLTFCAAGSEGIWVMPKP